jgi:hypothetical protein
MTTKIIALPMYHDLYDMQAWIYSPSGTLINSSGDDLSLIGGSAGTYSFDLDEDISSYDFVEVRVHISGTPTSSNILWYGSLVDTDTVCRDNYPPTDLNYIEVSVSGILEDTNEMQADLQDGGRLDLIFDGLLTSSSFGFFSDTIQGILNPLLLQRGTIGDSGNSTTALYLDNLDYPDNSINNLMIVFIDDGAGTPYHQNWVSAWDNSSKIASLRYTLPVTPTNSVDRFALYAFRDMPDVNITTWKGSVPSDLSPSGNLPSNILEIENSTYNSFILGAWTSNNRLDVSVSTRAATSDIVDAHVALSGQLSDGVYVTSMSSGAFSDIFETYQLGESYAATGVEATPAQVLYLMQQAFTEFEISGSSINVKSLDKSGNAATFEMNNSTAPTSRNRIT